MAINAMLPLPATGGNNHRGYRLGTKTRDAGERFDRLLKEQTSSPRDPRRTSAPQIIALFQAGCCDGANPHFRPSGGWKMPKLLRFIIWHLSTGFALGAVTTLVIAFRYPHALGHDGAIEPIALLLQIYAFGASFALGCLGTALMGKIE
ncbi:hypothetical protein IB267_18585 [Ensifer sp. ENS09]|uniref:hypothetical protein n=1 Tax=Ensifer sp. ENS09 TaxID=2769263 RepID=UPI001782F8C7|nr:hypothetical protein [Ensifer sp. ENS09]MBD9650352.1 hypothetical protein [Ensifer sp. ENS09]